MIVDLDALDGRSKSVDISIAADEIDLGPGNVRLSGPVHLKCQVSRSGFHTAVTGEIEADLEIACCRCLETTGFSPLLDLSVEFVDKEHFGAVGEHEIDSSNLSVDVLESDQLDLNSVVREQLILSLPEQIFCTKECKGLCEVCGANLNLKNCRCKSEEMDPRWSALKNLK